MERPYLECPDDNESLLSPHVRVGNCEMHSLCAHATFRVVPSGWLGRYKWNWLVRVRILHSWWRIKDSR